MASKNLTYIVGVGSVGKYVAHSLATGCLDPRFKGSQTVVLLFHRDGLQAAWEAEGRAIRAMSPDGRATVTADGFMTGRSYGPTANSRGIKHLIVATKAHTTAAALAQIKDQLTASSHILFLQNGMGVAEEVTEKVFPDPASRPRYWAGICSAGVYSTSPFTFVHAGTGPLTVSSLGPLHLGETECPMLSRLQQTPVLGTSLVQPGVLLQAQLRKLVVNSIINPLTVFFNCKNGGVFSIPEAARLGELLLEEAGTVVRAMLSDPIIEDARADFSDNVLRAIVRQVATSTAENISSMRQDVLASRPTEIDYINGYLVREAQKRGLPCKHHAAVVRAMKELEAGYLTSTATEDRDSLATRAQSILLAASKS
ncbi:hypothetical protein VTI74DRAFT_6409 [Chaetomium olivicolor]